MKHVVETLLLMMMLLALAGCAHERQVVTADAMKKCEIPAALREACPNAVALPMDITYGELVDRYRVDRESLRRCSLQRDDLAAAMEICNAAIDKHNVELAAKLKQLSGP